MDWPASGDTASHTRRQNVQAHELCVTTVVVIYARVFSQSPAIRTLNVKCWQRVVRVLHFMSTLCVMVTDFNHCSGISKLLSAAQWRVCVCTSPLKFGKGWWLLNAAQRVYELTGCYSNHGAWSYLSVLRAAMISRAAFPRRVCVLRESEAHSSIHGAGFTVATELGSCHRAQLHSWSATMQEGRRLRQTNYVKTASIEPLCLTQVWVCVKVLLC